MINVIVSGLGRIAWRYHLPKIKEDPRFNLLAISDPMEERRNEAAAEYPGINTYADYDQMLAAEKTADMVVIASPTMFHKPQTIAALERNLMVFLEKPMCESLESAQEVADAVKRTNGKLMLYQPHRHWGEYLMFQNKVRHKLGTITHSRRVLEFYNRRNDWQSRVDCGGGMLNNYGAHYIDQFLAAFGGPVEVKGAVMQRTVGIGDAEDLVSVLLQSSSGVSGTVEINLGAAARSDTWEVFGTLGSAKYCAAAKSWVITYIEPGTLPELQMQQTLAAQDRAYSLETNIPWITETVECDTWDVPSYYNYIYDYFADNKAPYVPLSESMELMRILDDCRKKAAGK